jgi:predicted nucleic acid-binding protein
MRFLLDTNVFREIGKTRPDANVAAWLDTVDDADLAISALTVSSGSEPEWVREMLLRQREQEEERRKRLAVQREKIGKDIAAMKAEVAPWEEGTQHGPEGNI